MKYLFSSIFAVVCLVSSSVYAQQTGEQLVANMIEAGTKLSYQGSYVFKSGDRMLMMKIKYRFKNNKEEERIMMLNGGEMEVFRSGGRVVCVHYDKKLEDTDHSIASRPFAHVYQKEFKEGLSHYDSVITSTDRVANLDATVVTIIPKDRQRYSYRVWISNDHYMLLKSQMLSADQQVLETFQYVELNMNPEFTDADFAIPTDRELVSHTRFVPRFPETVATNSEWIPDWKPVGYELKKASGRPGKETLIYSDGLSTFSIFVEPSESYDNMVANYGATVAVMRQVGDYSITLVGELPEQTARKIAQSIH